MDKVVGAYEVWCEGWGHDELEWVVHSFGEGGSVDFFCCFVAAFWAAIWGTTLRASVLDDWSITVFAEWSIHVDTGVRMYGDIYLSSGQGEGGGYYSKGCWDMCCSNSCSLSRPLSALASSAFRSRTCLRSWDTTRTVTTPFIWRVTTKVFMVCGRWNYLC